MGERAPQRARCVHKGPRRRNGMRLLAAMGECAACMHGVRVLCALTWWLCVRKGGRGVRA